MNSSYRDEEIRRSLEKSEAEFSPLCRVARGVTFRFRWLKWQRRLYDVWIFPDGIATFRAFVFFKKDEDIDACQRDGLTDAIQKYVCKQLERVGRGRKDKVTVAFEWDSDESVRRDYGGNYYDRLH